MGRPHLYLTALVALACAAGGAPARALSAEATVTLASDYRWRGLSMSDENPALQADGVLSTESGLWLEGWASTVSSDLGGLELGFGAGWSGAALGLDWTFGAMRYVYPDADDADYSELTVSAGKTFGPFTGTIGFDYAPEEETWAESDEYAWIALEAAAGERVTFRARAGRNDGAFAAFDGARDYEIGVAYALERVTFDLAHVEADSDDAALVAALHLSL